MKKNLWLFAAILAAFCLLFTFSACGGNDDDPENPDDPIEPIDPDDPNEPGNPNGPGDEPTAALAGYPGSVKLWSGDAEIDNDGVAIVKFASDAIKDVLDKINELDDDDTLLIELSEAAPNWGFGMITMYYNDTGGSWGGNKVIDITAEWEGKKVLEFTMEDIRDQTIKLVDDAHAETYGGTTLSEIPVLEFKTWSGAPVIKGVYYVKASS